MTVLLAYTVFLMTVSENLPRTSEFLPIFSVFITLVMTVTAASTICSILVIQVRFKGRTGKQPPKWLLNIARRGILRSLFEPFRRFIWWLLICANCMVHEDSGNGVTVYPDGLTYGRDEQEYMFAIVDEWDSESGQCKQMARTPSVTRKNVADQGRSRSFISLFSQVDTAQNSDQSDKEPNSGDIDNEGFGSMYEKFVKSTRELEDDESHSGTRKKIVAFKRSPLWRGSVKENSSKYERNMTGMLHAMAKQQRTETRELALEKLWTEGKI